MQEFKINGLPIYKGDYSFEEQYRAHLSQLLIENFGDGPYSEHTIARQAITYSFNYFCDKFLEVCMAENSVRFYQFILSQHEHAVKVALFAKPNDYPIGISAEYIAIYRRILKWTLEQACDVPLQNKEKTDAQFLNRAKTKLNELFFLGDMIFSVSNMYAQQDMIEDAVEVIFDGQNQYHFRLKHHYDHVIGELQKIYGAHSIKHVVDDLAVDDLNETIRKCFDLEYKQLAHVIAAIHELNKDKGGQYVGFMWEALPANTYYMFGKSYDQAKIFYQGLTLHKHNKLRIHDLACKPQTMNRFLYRPILIWNIDGDDFAVVGQNSFTESIIQLSTNAFPWGKGPQEWMENQCFQKYVHSKEDEHDKWLDDEAEKRINEKALPYFRNVKSIQTSNGSITLNIQNVGEIDFIIVDHKSQTVFIADCKHLRGRYDMITQKNDYSNFTKKKGYNNQLNNKIKWTVDNKTQLDFHFKHSYPDHPSIANYKVEGLFIINTPTFYMYNSDYRIYTVDVFVNKITRESTDPEFTIFIEDETSIKRIQVKYPYFRKPKYILFNTLGMD